MYIAFVSNSRIMPRRDKFGVELICVFGKSVEFYDFIAKNVRIRRTTFFIFVDKKLEYFIILFFAEINDVIRNIQSVANASDVAKIVNRATLAVRIGLIPIFHKKPDYVISSFLQNHCGNRTVDAA